jgi:hypothetical protein
LTLFNLLHTGGIPVTGQSMRFRQTGAECIPMHDGRVPGR